MMVAERTKHYYDFGYFFDAKNSGSCRVVLSEELEEDIDIADAINMALDEGSLDEDYADNILYVDHLSPLEASDMGFEVPHSDVMADIHPFRHRICDL